MIAKRSPLDLHTFLLIETEYLFTHPKEAVDDISVISNQYEIDIDYKINQDGETGYQLFVRIEINRDQSLPGYSLLAEGIGIFNFEPSLQLSKGDKFNFLLYSGISICINSLRSIISTLTAHGPFGKYLLPTIDVTDLIDQRRERAKQNLKEKSSKPTKVTRKVKNN